MCIGLRNVAYKQRSFGEQDAAIKSFERAVAVRRKLAFENPAVPTLKGELHKAWVDLGNYQRELGRAQQANRSFRAARDVLENIPRNSPDEMFELAVVYGALASPLEGTAEEPSADELAEQQQNAADAMERLQKAIDAGYRNVKALRDHKSLAGLQSQDVFQQMVDHLEKEIQAEKLAASDTGTDEQKLANRRQAVDVLRDLIGSDESKVRHRRTLAAALHSIGQIQLELSEFEESERALMQALEIRDQLRTENPDDPQLSLGVLAVQNSMGRWHWIQGDLPSAHRQWKECTRGLDDLREAHTADPEIQSRILAERHRMVMHYGSIGLWELVSDYERRCLENGKLNAGHAFGEFTAVLLAHGDDDFSQRYFHEYSEHLPTEDGEWSRVINLVRGLSTIDRVDLISDSLGNRAHRILERNTKKGWVAVGIAVMHYRRGEYEEALAILEPFKNTVEPQSTFLEAAVAFKHGEEQRARDRLSAGAIVNCCVLRLFRRRPGGVRFGRSFLRGGGGSGRGR